MALDPTLQESLYKLSIRKYFVDELVTARGIKIYFDRTYSIPVEGGVELSSWIVFNFGPIDIDIVSTNMLNCYCFTRHDPSQINLSVLRDKLLETIFDHNATDGVRHIPYLNDQKVQIGGIVPIISYVSENEFGIDGTNVKTVSIKMKWGTK